jgi:hypothetical protein
MVLPKGAQAFRKAVVGKLDAEQAKLTPLSQEVFLIYLTSGSRWKGKWRMTMNKSSRSPPRILSANVC